ncbi:restriction endonuclease subunit S [Pseudarthrobacter oxydans]|uniref:restriction endonuclease subunit S n=1 Tax=Pseudarthrobacter oxydans TaxID=1671 RepID=UPI00344BB77D
MAFPRTPIKYVTTFNDEVLPESFDPDGLIDYIEISDIDSYSGITGSTTLKFSEAPSRARRVIRADDVLISTVRTYLRAIASTDRAHDGYIASTGFCVLRPSKVHPGFLKYAASSPEFVEEVIARSTGISYPAINATDLVRLSIPVPCQKQQANIAEFLDRETTQIDDLIGKQERLIELLTEKRQGVISQAVTKGLDRTAPTQASGLPYLGEVPAHWVVRPFRLAAEYQEGPGIMAGDFLDEGVPLLRIAGVKDSYASLLGCKYLDPVKVATRWNHFRLGLEDLLISASASMGTVSEVGPETVGSIAYTGIIRLRPRAGVIKEFLKLLVVSDPFLRQIELHKTGSTMQHYGPSHLSQMRFAFPPTSEQWQIVDHVAGTCSRIDKILEKAHKSVGLLRERRSALISAAVSGRLDVPKYAAQP